MDAAVPTAGVTVRVVDPLEPGLTVSDEDAGEAVHPEGLAADRLKAPAEQVDESLFVTVTLKLTAPPASTLWLDGDRLTVGLARVQEASATITETDPIPEDAPVLAETLTE